MNCAINSIRQMGLLVFCGFFIIALAVLCASTEAQAQPWPETYESGLDREGVWRQANEYYRDAKFEEALAGYLYLESLGIRNGHLYFNLGNAYFALDRLGEAILWYERALRYIPRNEDLRVNLEYARGQLADEEFRQPRIGGIIALARVGYRFFNLREVLFATLILLWAAAIFWTARILVTRESIRNMLGIPCWTLTFAFILFFLCAGAKLYESAYVTEAVVTVQAIEVKTAPGQDFPAAFTLHEGTKVRIVRNEDGWVRVELPGATALTGWMPNDSVTII